MSLLPSDEKTPSLFQSLWETFRATVVRPLKFFDELDAYPWFPAFDYALVAAAIFSLFTTLLVTMTRFWLMPNAIWLALLAFVFNFFLWLFYTKVRAGLLNRVSRFFSGQDHPEFAYKVCAYTLGLAAFGPLTLGAGTIYAFIVLVLAIRKHFSLTFVEALVTWFLVNILLAVFFAMVIFPLWLAMAFVLQITGLVGP